MKSGTLLYKAIMFLLSAIMLISGVQVARYVTAALQQKSEYDDLAALVELSRIETAPPAESVPCSTIPLPSPEIAATEPTEPSMLAEYKVLYEKNPDTVGWISIDGTSVNYPVMQTPDRQNYYLKRNFSGADSAYGCLYVRETCDVFVPSDNVTIYGHHMNDGSMFATLNKFRTQTFWEEYHTIDFDTLYERHTYTVFAVFTTTASSGEGFAYHSFENAKDEADFDRFVSTCKTLSLYDTGITPQYGDKLICLSTCEYTQTNGRLVVVAVRDPEAPAS